MGKNDVIVTEADTRKLALRLLDKAGIEYLSVDAASNLELTKEFDVKKLKEKREKFYQEILGEK